MSEVIDFRKPLPKLKPITETPRKLQGFLATALEESKALETEKWAERERLAKEERRARGRQLISQGAAMLREEDGPHGADSWLLQNVSVVKTIGE